MNINKVILAAACIFLGAINSTTSFAKINMSKEYAQAFLGIDCNATQSEVEKRINDLKLEQAVRQAGYWTRIAKAYETLTDREFDLFKIRETAFISFPSELEKLAEAAARRILHVDKNATEEEIEAMMHCIEKQKVLRTPVQKLVIIIAYEYLTGNKRELTDIAGITTVITKKYLDKAIKNFQKVMEATEKYCKILGVAIDALKNEIEAKAQELWMQDIARTPEARAEINEASLYLTGKNLRF